MVLSLKFGDWFFFLFWPNEKTGRNDLSNWTMVSHLKKINAHRGFLVAILKNGGHLEISHGQRGFLNKWPQVSPWKKSGACITKWTLVSLILPSDVKVQYKWQRYDCTSNDQFNSCSILAFCTLLILWTVRGRTRYILGWFDFLSNNFKSRIYS